MSKFDKLFEARSAAEEERGTLSKETLPERKKTVKKPAKPVVSQSAAIPVPEADQAPATEPRKQRGRPKAKRSDPSFVGFTTYIRRDTHLKAKIALLQEGRNRELSELVESLLVDWLKANGKNV